MGVVEVKSFVIARLDVKSKQFDQHDTLYSKRITKINSFSVLELVLFLSTFKYYEVNPSD
jgi:hypothetical protein